MPTKPLSPVQVALPPIGEGPLASIVLPDLRTAEKLAGVEQRIRELASLLSAAERERLRLMNRVADVRQQLLEMEAMKAILGGYEVREVVLGWHVYAFKGHEASQESLACPEWHHAEGVTPLLVINVGRQQTIYRCTSSSCRFLMPVEAAG